MDLGSAGGDPWADQSTASPPVHFIQQLVPQQPEVTILQQMPWIPSSLPLSNRGGQIREDLMELMLIQNAQMHQVIMNNLAMSSLASFGLTSAQPAAQVTHLPWQVEEDEDDDPEPLVFHHHYAPCPTTLPFTAWQPQSQPQPLAWPQPNIRHVGPDPKPEARQDDEAVPPPPPPSATGTVTADVPPAEEYYDYTQGRF
ncbi:proline-rich protein 29 [Heteronotia binoei]|uniref:proline-rich protein 29 n=1 Tax=Heteronotia binoei TaxID=13085 RepID=UPI00292E1B9C|nr:proline-rich protein 29 [Heteronotia binoei]